MKNPISNFKTRLVTNGIVVVPMGTTMSFEEFATKCWTRGLFGTGYHLVIEADGSTHEDRPLGAIADNRFAANKTSIYIATADTKEAKEALEELLSDLVDAYELDKDADVTYVDTWTAMSKL